MPKNPAKRVHDLLEKVREQRNAVHLIHGFSNALGLPDDSKSHSSHARQVYETIGSIQDQLDLAAEEVRSRFAQQPSKIAHLLKHFPAITQALAVNPFGGMSDFINLVKDDVLYSLEMVSLETEEEAGVTKEELDVLRDEVNDLITMVKNSDLRAPLKKFILSQLDRIIRAIHVYFINGTKGLQDALAQMVGEIVVMKPVSAAIKEKDPGIFDKLLKVCNNIITIAKVPESIQKMCELTMLPEITDRVTTFLM